METKLQNIYAINYAIQHKKEFWYQALFEIFESIKDILDLDYFLFLEKSPIVPGYITYRYDSRHKWLLQSESFKYHTHSDFATIFSEIDIIEAWMIQRITFWDETQWYIIMGKSRYDRNVTNVIANLLSSPIHICLSKRFQ